MDRKTMLERTVIDELTWDPRIDASRVSVSSDGATVTLGGSVHSYTEKVFAEALARHVKGVAGVKNALDVRLTIGDYRTDATLQRIVTDILLSLPRLRGDAPQGSVRSGWLTLTGVVDCEAQKHAAENAFLQVAGIRGVTNQIRIIPLSDNTKTKESFEAAVRRRAALEVDGLRVVVEGALMMIYGSVASCVERDALLEIASCAPGVASVEDHIVVRPKRNRNHET
jgi:osmotically-inducible protein OsmY